MCLFERPFKIQKNGVFLFEISFFVLEILTFFYYAPSVLLCAPSVVKLLNLSIHTSQFPKLWKCAKITALFKSGDRTNVSNYRPISILPTLTKILERVVHLQLYQYLITNNFLSNKQFGFRKGFSTTTALSSFADEVLLNMERGKLCGAVFIDLTKAFDTVDHQIMLCKLSEIGLSESALHWFRSYLTGRQQRTSCSVGH